MARLALVAITAVLLPASAMAGDPYGSKALARGDLAAAETALNTRMARNSVSPVTRLNLAEVYARTGRDAAATELYRAVLNQKNAELQTTDGDRTWSHDLARAALRPAMVASR